MVMSSLVFVFLAAGSAALSNLFFRKNFTASTKVYTSNGYLLVFYFFAFILSFFIYPNLWTTNINFTVVLIGGCVGFLNVALMIITGRALQKGPAGLTFAFQNASAVFPGLILFSLFDSSFGFSCSNLQLVGMVLVILGLFLGAKKESSDSIVYLKWLKYALICFIVQILALTLIQGRCVLFEEDKLEGILAYFAFTETDDIWFMPGQFGVALVLQSLIFLKEKRKLQSSEMICGSLGGFANFGSTCLLLLATKLALPWEKCILFPCFSVATIILCNLWANRLYKENFNLGANSICSFGIFLSVLN